MDQVIGGMKMDRTTLKKLGRMVNKMDYGLCGMKMDKNKWKGL